MARIHRESPLLALYFLLRRENKVATGGRPGRSAYAIVKAELGFRDSGERVYEQLRLYLREQVPHFQWDEE